MTRWLKIAALPLCLLWLITILVAYYWGQQGVLIFAALGLVRLLWTGLLIGLIGICCYGIGRFLSRRLNLTFHNQSEQLIFNLGLGHLLFTLLILAMGVANLLSTSTFWILTIAAGLPASVYSWRTRRPTDVTNQSWPAWTTWEKIYLTALGLNVAVGLFLSLAPPVGWDGLSTHLVLVRESLLSGTFLAEPVFQRPLAGHMLYIWGYALGGESMPQLLSYSLALLSLVAVWSWVEHRFDRSTALFATVILSAVEVYMLTSTWPYADMPLVWFTLLATLAFLRWAESEEADNRQWLVLAALFAGTAFSTKLNGLFLLPPLLVCGALVVWWRRDAWRHHLVNIIIATVSGGLVWAVWRLAGRWLASDSAATLERLNGTLARSGADLTFLEQLGRYLRLPFEMTILGQQGLVIFDGRISPLFLILIPILLFLPRKPRSIRLLLVFAVLELAAWIIVPQGYYQTRHLMIAFPLFSILAGYTLSRMPELDQSWFTLSGFWRVIIVVVLTMQLFFYLDWLTLHNPLPYVFGFEDRDTYLARNLNGGTAAGYYDMMQAIRDQVEEDATVAFIRPEPRTFYCKPIRCVQSPVRGRYAYDEIRPQLVAQEADYVLISWAGLTYFQAFNADNPAARESWQRLERHMSTFVAENGTLVHEDGDYSLYRLTDE